MYKTKVELRYQKIGSWANGDPFTLAFCRTEKHGNVLVTGGLHVVEEYIVANLGRTLVALRFAHHGSTRGYCKMYNCKPYWITSDGLTIYGEDGIVAQYNKIPSSFPRALQSN